MQVYMLPYCRNFKCGNSRRLLTVKPAFLPQPYRVCTLVILSQFVHFVHLLSVHVNHNLNPLFLNMTIPLPQKISLVLPHLWSLSVKMDQSKARPESIVDLVLFGCGAAKVDELEQHTSRMAQVIQQMKSRLHTCLHT